MFSVLTWNVENLYRPGGEFGPVSEQVYTAKLDHLAAIITGSGALSAATNAILVPVGLAFAHRYRISPLLVGLSILNGTNAGGFSPIAVYYNIVSSVLAVNGVEIDPVPIFVATFLVNVLLNIITFFMLDGRDLIRNRGKLRRTTTEAEASHVAAPERAAWSPIQLVTIGLMVGIIVGVAASAFFAPMIAAVTGWFETNRSLAVSLVSAGMGVAPLTISPFARWLITAYDWRTAMFIIGIGSIFALVPPI